MQQLLLTSRRPAAPLTVTASFSFVVSYSIHYGFSITTVFIILTKKKVVVKNTKKSSPILSNSQHLEIP
jgi:hypothetical protein